MQPVVCNKDMAVVFPLKDGDCEFRLEIVDSVDDIANPSRDHAYVDSKGLFYIYNGKEIQVINDHANLKIKWGNMIGDISNQLDLMEILNQFVKTISVNGTNIAKDNNKNIAIQVPITTIKLDGNTISPVDYIVDLDLASVYAKKTEIPKNVSELQNDAGYIKQEVVDQLIPIKAIKVNNVTILPDENRTVNIENVYVTPEEFGAIGDGTTDDSAAFNACILKATETGKFILLSNKTYYIPISLNDVIGINFIGLNANIKLLNNTFCSNMANCYIQRVNFSRVKYNIANVDVFGNLSKTSFKQCMFSELFYLCISLDDNITDEKQTYILFDECHLTNTGIFNGNSSNLTENEYIITNSTIKFNSNTRISNNIINGSTGGMFTFDNTIFINSSTNQTPIFNTYDDLIFNRCYIDNNTYNTTEFISVLKGLYDKSILNILFDDCTVKNIKNGLVKTNDDITNLYVNVKITQSKLELDKLIHSNLECSLWLENNIMDVKPIVNSGTGKVNIVEIQQKYSDTSENIFPWTQETPQPTPTVENNVSINSDGTSDYYVLTENEDKTIKKLDYYFKYDVGYLPNAPYYSSNFFVRGLDLEGYTVKKSHLSNNTCRLKNKGTGELIDYVYLMLDDNVTVTTTKDTQLTYTSIAMKYLPYFAKLKTDTPVAGQLDVDLCISIILEKTSS